ncbi:hypothetical protein C1N53_17910 [Pontibacter sp. SGAir0037]|nr:hypothetical protein C1N53_17910 [Pontibacter sp. SGAir0037]
MAPEVKHTWRAVNRMLTIINLSLCMVLTGQGFIYERVRGNTVPVYLNMLLLFILSFVVFIAFYRLLS